MDEVQDTIAELLELTARMAESDSAGDAFDRLIDRRGELIRLLCGNVFDPSDGRIVKIAVEGTKLLAKARARRDSLREDIAGLDRAAVLVGGVKSTIFHSGCALDVSA